MTRSTSKRALRAGEPLGGHYVQGHVDGVGTVRSVDEGEARSGSTPTRAHALLVEKGSITVDGVSLTVAAVDERGFAVALVPHTLEVTTLGTLAAGDARQSRDRRPREVRRAATTMATIVG